MIQSCDEWRERERGKKRKPNINNLQLELHNPKKTNANICEYLPSNKVRLTKRIEEDEDKLTFDLFSKRRKRREKKEKLIKLTLNC